MSDASLLHLVIPAPRLPHRHARESVAVAAALHALAGAVLITLTLVPGSAGRRPETKGAAPEAVQVPRIVFLQVPGPGGGGGGGGNRNPSPPSRAENVGRDPTTLPVAPPVRAARDPADACHFKASRWMRFRLHPVSPIRWARRLRRRHSGSRRDLALAAVLATDPAPGSGRAPAPGVGPGTGGGVGGGVYQPGNVTAPTLRSQARPNYTSEAMQRKIQGTVVLEMIVGSDGVPYNLREVRSLDARGLDEEAIRAAKEWRFNPGRFGETPVAVMVRLVIDFHLR